MHRTKERAYVRCIQTFYYKNQRIGAFAPFMRTVSSENSMFEMKNKLQHIRTTRCDEIVTQRKIKTEEGGEKLGKNDIRMKRWLSDKKRFASLVNGALFHNREVFSPETLHPVLTIVLYYGNNEKGWDGQTDLHGLTGVNREEYKIL